MCGIIDRVGSTFRGGICMVIWFGMFLCVALAPEPDFFALMTPVERLELVIPIAVIAAIGLAWYRNDKRRIMRLHICARDICEYNICHDGQAEWEMLVKEYRYNVAVGILLSVLFCPLPLCFGEYLSNDVDVKSVIKYNNKILKVVNQ